MERQEWAGQCRRGIARPLRDRIRFGFVKTYRPVLDDAPSRVFNTMAEYRKWCHENLPEYLGFRLVDEERLREIEEARGQGPA